MEEKVFLTTALHGGTHNPDGTGIDCHFLMGFKDDPRSFCLDLAFFFEFLPFESVQLTPFLVSRYKVMFHLKLVGWMNLERGFPLGTGSVRFVAEPFSYGFFKRIQVWDLTVDHGRGEGEGGSHQRSGRRRVFESGGVRQEQIGNSLLKGAAARHV